MNYKKRIFFTVCVVLISSVTISLVFPLRGILEPLFKSGNKFSDFVHIMGIVFLTVEAFKLFIHIGRKYGSFMMSAAVFISTILIGTLKTIAFAANFSNSLLTGNFVHRIMNRSGGNEFLYMLILISAIIMTLNFQIDTSGIEKSMKKSF